jgi:hypothetical protein
MYIQAQMLELITVWKISYTNSNCWFYKCGVSDCNAQLKLEDIRNAEVEVTELLTPVNLLNVLIPNNKLLVYTYELHFHSTSEIEPMITQERAKINPNAKKYLTNTEMIFLKPVQIITHLRNIKLGKEFVPQLRESEIKELNDKVSKLGRSKNFSSALNK